MSDKISQRGTSMENAYFAQKEHELLAAIAKAKADGLDGVEGLSDEGRALLRKWDITVAHLPALHVVPLVQVAWADGDIHIAERTKIEDVLRARGLGKDSEGWALIQGALDSRPAPAFFADLTSVLASGVEGDTSDLLGLATAVAQAAGGFLGFARIDAQEKEAIQELARTLAAAHPEAAAEVTGG